MNNHPFAATKHTCVQLIKNRLTNIQMATYCVCKLVVHSSAPRNSWSIHSRILHLLQPLRCHKYSSIQRLSLARQWNLRLDSMPFVRCTFERQRLRCNRLTASWAVQLWSKPGIFKQPSTCLVRWRNKGFARLIWLSSVRGWQNTSLTARTIGNIKGFVRMRVRDTNEMTHFVEEYGCHRCWNGVDKSRPTTYWC